MILVPRPLASCKYNEPVSYSKFSLGVHYADSFSMGVVSSSRPAETSADVTSPCLIERAVSRLFSIASAVAKAIAKRPQ